MLLIVVALAAYLQALDQPWCPYGGNMLSSECKRAVQVQVRDGDVHP